MADRLRDALARGPVLLDAAMGTRLIARGLRLADDDPSLWNLDHPDLVLEIHRRDVEAGSDAILTNTFGANRAWLARFDRSGRVEAINRRAVDLAREAAGPDRIVIGCLGPSGLERPEVYRDQAAILIDEGVDALILETLTEAQARLGLGRLRGLSSPPILVSLHSWTEPTSESVRTLLQEGAWAIGGNCSPGMDGMIRLADALHEVANAPLMVKPGAGLPGGPMASPESFARAVPALVASGVRLIGGCCGTTETHVAALRAALADLTRLAVSSDGDRSSSRPLQDRTA